jgi:hypothetical protein
MHTDLCKMHGMLQISAPARRWDRKAAYFAFFRSMIFLFAILRFCFSKNKFFSTRNRAARYGHTLCGL